MFSTDSWYDLEFVILLKAKAIRFAEGPEVGIDCERDICCFRVMQGDVLLSLKLLRNILLLEARARGPTSVLPSIMHVHALRTGLALSGGRVALSR